MKSKNLLIGLLVVVVGFLAYNQFWGGRSKGKKTKRPKYDSCWIMGIEVESKSHLTKQGPMFAYRQYKDTVDEDGNVIVDTQYTVRWIEPARKNGKVRIDSMGNTIDTVLPITLYSKKFIIGRPIEYTNHN